MRTSVVMATLMYLSVLFYSDRIVHIFNSENNIEITRIAGAGLRIYFIGFFFVGVNIVTAVLLSATESARDAFSITMARGLMVIVPMVLVLSRILDMTGVWLAFVITELLVTILAVYLTRESSKSARNKKMA